MTITYLLDVDDTLAFIDGNGNVVFNDEQINSLITKSVTNVTLLTKMEVSNAKLTSRIRLELINYLKDKGITVDAVLCPADLVLRAIQADPTKYPLGTFYEKHMKPVEESLLNLKKLNNPKENQKDNKTKNDNNIPQKFHVYHEIMQYERDIASINFLINNNFLDKDAHLKNITKKIEGGEFNFTHHNGICKFLLKKYPYNPTMSYGENLTDADFSTILSINELPTRIARICEAQKESDITLEKLIKKFEEECNKLKTDLEKIEPKLTDLEKEALEKHNSTLTQYRNIFKIIEIQYEKAPDNLKIEISKGNIYKLFCDQKKFTSKDIVCFSDDAKDEHESLTEIHKEQNYNHLLLSLFPATIEKIRPLQTGNIDPENFRTATTYTALVHYCQQHLGFDFLEKLSIISYDDINDITKKAQKIAGIAQDKSDSAIAQNKFEEAMLWSKLAIYLNDSDKKLENSAKKKYINAKRKMSAYEDQNIKGRSNEVINLKEKDNNQKKVIPDCTDRTKITPLIELINSIKCLKHEDIRIKTAYFHIIAAEAIETLPQSEYLSEQMSGYLSRAITEIKEINNISPLESIKTVCTSLLAYLNIGTSNTNAAPTQAISTQNVMK